MERYKVIELDMDTGLNGSDSEKLDGTVELEEEGIDVANGQTDSDLKLKPVHLLHGWLEMQLSPIVESEKVTETKTAILQILDDGWGDGNAKQKLVDLIGTQNLHLVLQLLHNRDTIVCYYKLANCEGEQRVALKDKMKNNCLESVILQHFEEIEEEVDNKETEVVQRKDIQLKRPLAFQRLGDIVWKDPEPQSCYAQHPWVLSHERENKEGIRKMIKSVIDPQVEDLRSFKLTCEDTLDMRTEYFTVVNEPSQWGPKSLKLVPREEGSEKLSRVKVRRTIRNKGRGGGTEGDQERVEDLRKPVIMLALPCGHIQSFSVDFSLCGLDTKLIRMINQRTGSYCYGCRISKQEAHSLERVREGFLCDMGMSDLLSVVEDIMLKVPKEERDTYEVSSVPGDTDTRFGIKGSPLSSILDSTRVIAVLHTGLLRCFGWVEQLIIRLCSKCLFWGKGRIPPEAKKRKEDAEEEWKGEHEGYLLGFKHSKAPNQVTGYMCKLMFSKENRENIIIAVSMMRGWKEAWKRHMSEAEKQQLRTLLQRQCLQL